MYVLCEAVEENVYILISGTSDISCDFEDGDCLFSNSKTRKYDWIIKKVSNSLALKTGIQLSCEHKFRKQ
jgi:hypothetical protein